MSSQYLVVALVDQEDPVGRVVLVEVVAKRATPQEFMPTMEVLEDTVQKVANSVLPECAAMAQEQGSVVSITITGNHVSVWMVVNPFHSTHSTVNYLPQSTKRGYMKKSIAQKCKTVLQY